jgi:predicted metal-dependent HD superfamily phosphohydrolase
MNAPEFQRWNELWQRAGCHGDAKPRFELLRTAYAEPQRRYHNFQHIAECLVLFDDARGLANNPDAVEMAIWFHDSVYDPKAPDNEERSADLATRQLSDAGASTELVEAVARLVLATKTHNAGSDVDTSVLLDVDLSILGQPEMRFQEYERQIHEEYSWVPIATYKPKRAEILQGFLDRKRIYVTDLFREKFEQQARANLRWSIQQLEAMR